MDSIQKLTELFKHFPGIGPRQAKRFVYFLLTQKGGYTGELSGLISELKKEISRLSLPVSVYVFSLEDFDYSDEFADIKPDISVCTIPEAILRVYRRIYGKGQLKMKMLA